MDLRIDRAAVIGSGVMGAGIAAHLANCGIPVYLFDVVPHSVTEEEVKRGLSLSDLPVRNRIVEANRARLLKEKPAPLYIKEKLELITPCNLEDDLERLREVDWIVEAVVERLDVKRQVLAKIEAYRQEHAIVSTNTSGLSVEKMSEGRSVSFRQHFLGTHFFNPPRYLKLVELIPTAETDEKLLLFMKRFMENGLGKGVVVAKDTPNFIANRIGCYGLMVTVSEMIVGGFGIGEADSLTGPLIGRPKSATFRTLDLVGLDTFAEVAATAERAEAGAEQLLFRLPPFMEEMLKRGLTGEKSGAGFYKKERIEGKSTILELDIDSFSYVPRRRLNAPSVQQAKSLKDPVERIKFMVNSGDKAGQFVWNVLKRVLLYTAETVWEIADDILSVDQAMKWGFGWELGPFELWDALGLDTTVQRMKNEGEHIPQWVDEMLNRGHHSFYAHGQNKGRVATYHPGRPFENNYHVHEVSEKIISLPSLKDEGKVIKQNAGASLIDLGDGVALLEFHSPNQAIGADILRMLHTSLNEVAQNYDGLVIGNQGTHFCVGANLMLILMEAQEMNWPELSQMIRHFQEATTAIRYSVKPVVAAPFSMTLGGGTEFCLPAAKIQAAAETYMGLVETGVGLIPGGGGNKEMLLRLYERITEGTQVDLQPLVNHAFETIALAKVSGSAYEARAYGFIRPQDGITINQDHLLYEAKQAVIQLAQSGYRPPEPKSIPVLGREGKAVLMLGAYHLKESGMISDHDYKIAEKLAHVLCGGDLPQGTRVNEQYLLDIEREAFLSLCGEPKSIERMSHMLRKGKPLRN